MEEKHLGNFTNDIDLGNYIHDITDLGKDHIYCHFGFGQIKF